MLVYMLKTISTLLILLNIQLFFAGNLLAQENKDEQKKEEKQKDPKEEEEDIQLLDEYQKPLPIIRKGKTASGIRYEVHKEGEGPAATENKPITVHYTGWLDNNGKKGRKFDSSRDRRSAFLFYLGRKMVIKGWEEGIKGMKLGERRTLYIPAELAYGEDGVVKVIPSNADLIFDVELMDIYE